MVRRPQVEPQMLIPMGNPLTGPPSPAYRAERPPTIICLAGLALVLYWGRKKRAAPLGRRAMTEQQDEAALRTVQIMIKSPNGSDKDFCLTMPLDDTRVRDVKRLLHQQD